MNDQILDISEHMTDQFFHDAKRGKVLGFKQDGIVKHYRIVKLNRKKRICKVIETSLHDLKEADEIIKEDLTLDDVVKEFQGITLSTTDDVRRVLQWIAPTGKKRELKREAIKKLFTTRSPQGFTTADTLESYEEF